MHLWLLFFHILMALWLTGGVFSAIVVRAQIKRAGSLEEKVFGLRTAKRLIGIYGMPGAIGVGIFGMALLGGSGYGFELAWLKWSTILYLLILGNSLFYLAPRVRRMAAAGEASLKAGAPTEEFKSLAAAKLPGILSDINALGIVVITLLMVLKPA